MVFKVERMSFVRYCDNLLPFLIKHPIQNNHPFQLIFKLYHQQFLNVSIEKGLKRLNIAVNIDALMRIDKKVVSVKRLVLM